LYISVFHIDRNLKKYLFRNLPLYGTYFFETDSKKASLKKKQYEKNLKTTN